jgi:hypothetical protein
VDHFLIRLVQAALKDLVGLESRVYFPGECVEYGAHRRAAFSEYAAKTLPSWWTISRAIL